MIKAEKTLPSALFEFQGIALLHIFFANEQFKLPFAIYLKQAIYEAVRVYSIDFFNWMELIYLETGTEYPMKSRKS